MLHCLASRAWFLLLLLLLAPTARAQSDAADYLTRIPDPKSLGETFVSNPDGVLSPATVADLNVVLRGLDQRGRAHLDVAVVRSIGDAVPKTAAYELFRRWRIGAKGQDNGLLMLLVMDQRRVEFETGYGLEADVPDVVCFRLQQRFMVPLLRQGQTDAAVRQGVAALIRQLDTGSIEPSAATAATDSAVLQGGSPEAAQALARGETGAAPAAGSGEDFSGWRLLGLALASLLSLGLYALMWDRLTHDDPARKRWLLLLLLPAGLLLASIFTLGRLSSWWVLGVGYGGPGLWLLRHLLGLQRRFGEAAAAGQSREVRYNALRPRHARLRFVSYLYPPLLWLWQRQEQQLHALREAPYACAGCGQPMRLLSPKAANRYLDAGQREEQKLKAVEYDVWHCEGCARHLTLRYPVPDAEADICPECHYQTFRSAGVRVEEAATTVAEGWGWQLHRCRHCGYEQRTRYTIGRLAPVSSSSASSSDSDSSWSSSSSSSDSDYSSSSGGESGGGGSGSSW